MMFELGKLIEGPETPRVILNSLNNLTETITFARDLFPASYCHTQMTKRANSINTSINTGVLIRYIEIYMILCVRLG